MGTPARIAQDLRRRGPKLRARACCGPLRPSDARVGARHVACRRGGVPDSRDILFGLSRIANEAFAFAVGWHVVLAGVFVALLRGLRPAAGLTAALVSASLGSVGVFAWRFDNPFNAAVFLAAAALLALLAWRKPAAVPPATPRMQVLGAVLLAFAWVYPHFLEQRSPLAYLIGSPLGLLPCPTLSFGVGLTLLGRAPSGRAWPGTLAVIGLLYGLLGALRLGVVIDLVLVAGALALLVHSVKQRPGRPHRPPAQVRHFDPLEPRGGLWSQQ